MQKKKSRFLLFIFSFIPGAGEMYLGFMKMGVSLMLGFGLMMAVVGITNLGALTVFPIVMYCYSFFHANNLGSLDEATFCGMRDQYLFGLESLDDVELVKKKINGKYKKIVAAVLIIIGVVMLWQEAFNLLCDIFGWDNYYLSAVYYFVRDDVPRIIIGIAVIWCGIMMIRGKKVDAVAEGQSVFEEPYAAGGQRVYTEGINSSSAEHKEMTDEQAAAGMQDESVGQERSMQQSASDNWDQQ